MVEGSIRLQDTRRKDARKARAERKRAERVQEVEELKRLKNLKKAELAQKVERLRQVCGKANVPDDVLDDFEDDFDPAAHDAKMSRLFDDEYFEGEEHKPAFSDSEEEMVPVTKAMKKATKLVKKTLKRGSDPRLLDELYKLDYEDKIDGMACRFKYQSVQPTSFGLDPVEIMAADDANLNAHASIKKLAPYRPPDKQAQDIHKLSDKRRLYQFRTRLLESLRQNAPIKCLPLAIGCCPDNRPNQPIASLPRVYLYCIGRQNGPPQLVARRSPSSRTPRSLSNTRLSLIDITLSLTTKTHIRGTHPTNHISSTP